LRFFTDSVSRSSLILDFDFKIGQSFTMLSKLKELIEYNDEKSNEQVIELLKDADIYTLLYPHGENLLHWAAAFNNATIAEYLLKEKEFHPNIDNFRGTTPLYYGCMKNAEAAVEVLLKYHAQPRIRSGFSGIFPIDIVTSDSLRAKLQVEAPANHYKAYKYRSYMYWRMNLSYFVGDGKSIAQGVTINPEAERIVKESGIAALGAECTRLLLDYVNNSNEAGKDFAEVCLVCGKNENLQRCLKCDAVWFCNEDCRRASHLLHKFDCPVLTVASVFTCSSSN
jgi:hypothetical protein